MIDIGPFVELILKNWKIYVEFNEKYVVMLIIQHNETTYWNSQYLDLFLGN